MSIPEILLRAARPCLLLLFALTAVSAAGPSENWPQWRGPNHDGTSDTAANLPVRWSRTENVKWRVKAESWSAATPICPSICRARTRPR